MQFLIPLLFLIITIGWSVYRAKTSHNPLDKMANWPFEKRVTPLTPEEITFYQALKQYLPSSVVVFPKMRIQNLVFASPESRITYALLDKMQDKYLDFTICEANSLNIICVIEFADPAAPPRKANEVADTERILQNAAITFFRYQPQYQYSEADFAPINELYQNKAY